MVSGHANRYDQNYLDIIVGVSATAWTGNSETLQKAQDPAHIAMTNRYTRRSKNKDGNNQSTGVVFSKRSYGKTSVKPIRNNEASRGIPAVC